MSEHVGEIPRLVHELDDDMETSSVVGVAGDVVENGGIETRARSCAIC